MALSVFKIAFPDLILTDLRNSNDLLGFMAGTPTSQMVSGMMNEGGPHLTGQMEHITLANTGDLITSGSLSYLSGVFQMQDASYSAAYPLVAGTQINFLNNRLAVGTVKVPYDYEKWHQAGDQMKSFVKEGLVQQIQDQIETAMFGDMLSEAIYASGSTAYDLDTSAQANLLGDYEVLSTLAEARNWGGGRVIAANTELKHAALGYTNFTSQDFNQAHNPVAGGGLSVFNGWQHLYTNNATAGSAVAFDTTKYACVLGVPQIEELVDKDERSTFIRCAVYFGYGALGAATNDGDGTSVSQKEGLARITVA